MAKKKRPLELSPFESMILANASEALDQRNDSCWIDLADCLDSYYTNVQDTAMEMGMRPSEHGAWELYRAYVRQVASKLGVVLPEDYRE